MGRSRYRSYGMKIWIWCFLVLFCLCFIPGCSYDAVTGAAKGDKHNDNTANNSRKRLISVGLSQIGSESDWRMASTDSVREALSTENGFDLNFEDAQQKQENQLKAVREFIDQSVDYIIIDPVVETGWESVLSEAKEAGIPVIIYDRKIDVEDESLYTCWIGSDFELEGERACAWLGEYLQSGGVDRNINIVDIQGTIGATAQIGRSSAIEKASDLNKKWFLLGSGSGDFTTAKGKEVMDDMLDRFGNSINVVYAENDNMAYGAIEAMEKRGYTVGTNVEEGEILVLSFDATKYGLDLTLKGKIAADTECNPLYGPRLVEIIDRLEKGEEVEKETYIDEEQFSGIGYIGTIQVRNRAYTVTHLTSEVLEKRVY